MALPYSKQPRAAFWKNCRESSEFLFDQLYTPRHQLRPGESIATAGSCFAQNIGRFVRASDLDLLDVEPAPAAMPPSVMSRYGYGVFSARYGNIYTPRQLKQLVADCLTLEVHDCAIWSKDGSFFDALRPSVEPLGLESEELVKVARIDHLKRVKDMFEKADLFIFTLGLTETWQHTSSGVVFPSVPGAIAGTYQSDQHSFMNTGFVECLNDMREAIGLMQKISPRIKVLLTVSPVPLTATATNNHVLRATTYSKSVLRAVSEELSLEFEAVDYFPSYEMITGIPFISQSYDSNLRSVKSSAVDRVMSVFFGAHPDVSPTAPMDIAEALPEIVAGADSDEIDELICEEALLEAFAKK